MGKRAPVFYASQVRKFDYVAETLGFQLPYIDEFGNSLKFEGFMVDIRTHRDGGGEPQPFLKMFQEGNELHIFLPTENLDTAPSALGRKLAVVTCSKQGFLCGAVKYCIRELVIHKPLNSVLLEPEDSDYDEEAKAANLPTRAQTRGKERERRLKQRAVVYNILEE